MNKRTAGRQASALVILGAALVVVASVAAVAVLGRAAPLQAAPIDRPVSRPVSRPVLTPVPVPAGTPVVTPAPSDEPAEAPLNEPSDEAPADEPSDAVPLCIELETVTGQHVYVDIVDDTFSVVAAESGTPTASASVEPYTLKVENIDDHTLRLTWVDRPGDNALALFIDRPASRILLVQPEHDTEGDAILHDRVLILTFRDAIAADSIETFLQDGLDTPG